MDCVIGIVGKDYVMFAADASSARSIVVFKQDEDKIINLDSHKMMVCAGPVGDRYQFQEYIQRNLNLYALRWDVPLSTQAAANFTRGELAYALRRGPFQTDILIGGYDKKKGPSMYFMDYLASMHKLKKAALGYGAYFTLGLLDKFCKKDMTIDEGKEVMKKCIAELQIRFLISKPKFILKVVDKNGTREINLEEPAMV